MTEQLEKTKVRRFFHAHETDRAATLEGVPLATFWQRFLGYFIDVMLAVLVWFPIEFAWRRYLLHQQDINLRWDFHEKGNIVVMVFYWGLFTYFWQRTDAGQVGRSGRRVLSLTGERMGPWQSLERALGYGAALLEAGLGFFQFFWDRNRMCAQDRLAETIVVDVRKKSQLRSISSQNDLVGYEFVLMS